MAGRAFLCARDRQHAFRGAGVNKREFSGADGVWPRYGAILIVGAALSCVAAPGATAALPAACPRFGAPEPDPAGRRPAGERPLRKGNGPVWGEPTPGRGAARFREFPPLPSASRGGFKCGVEKIQLSIPSGRGQAAPAVTLKHIPVKGWRVLAGAVKRQSWNFRPRPGQRSSPQSRAGKEMAP